MATQADIEDIRQLIADLGYQHEEAREFYQARVAEIRAEKEAERAERQADREAKEADRQAKEADRQAKEANREHAERQAQADREAREAEIAHAERQAQADREAREADRQANEAELRLKIELAQVEPGPQPRAQARDRVKLQPPRLPRFDDGKDRMDAYLERFERFLTAMEVPKEEWSFQLASVLTGKALEVYSGMTTATAAVYDTLKCNLLQRYDMTEEGYRKKFRELRPEGGETAPQFVSKLKHNFETWLNMAKVGDDGEEIRDFMIRDQFLKVTHVDLNVYLRER